MEPSTIPRMVRGMFRKGRRIQGFRLTAGDCRPEVWEISE